MTIPSGNNGDAIVVRELEKKFGAFTAVAHAAPSEKADLLAAAISVGMNTTAFGLMFGIPLMMLHSYMVAKTGSIVDSLEMASVKTLNIISSSTRRNSGAEKAA